MSNVHPVFVNYTQSSQWRDKTHHRAAQSFVSGHYRRKNPKIPLETRASLLTKAEDEHERIEAAALMSRLSTPSSLLTLLGAARRDPFDTYCVSILPVYVHEVLDHGKAQCAPSTFASCKREATTTRAKPCLQHPLQSRSVWRHGPLLTSESRGVASVECLCGYSEPGRLANPQT